MKLTKLKIKNITNEFSQWVESQYAGKSLKERQEFGQFFTPPELTIQMIEQFDNLEGTILDPTCGCGGLLAGCILAGANPKLCYGIELDPEILKICQERLSKLGVPKENIHLGNALNDDCYEFKDGYHYDVKTDIVTFNGKQEFKFGYN